MPSCYARVEEAGNKVFALAGNIRELADALGVPRLDLDHARDALEGAENLRAAVAMLGAVATQLERNATAQLRALCAPVPQLAGMCRGHGEEADAMQKVQRATDDISQQRANTAGGTIENK